MMAYTLLNVGREIRGMIFIFSVSIECPEPVGTSEKWRPEESGPGWFCKS
jgi:hypothetical protein